jgi:multidrug efflux pump
VNLPRFSVSNPVFIHLVLLFIVIFGLYTYSRLPRAKDPDVSFQAALVLTLDRAKSPEEIEESITTPIEDELDQLTDVNKVQSVSSEGISTIYIEWEQDLEDFQAAMDDLRNAVNQVQDLPESADAPRVIKLTTAIEPAVFVVLGGDMTPDRLKLYADSLDVQIRRIPDVGKVQFIGERDREVEITLDPERLNAHGLTPLDVARAIQLRHRNVSAGPVKTGTREELIRVEGEFQNPRDFEQLVLLTQPDGSVVKLGDVGRASLGYEDVQTMAKLNGRPALALQVFRRKKGDVVAIVAAVKKLVEEFKKGAPASLDVTTVYDTARDIRDRLRILVSNGLMGMALVWILLYLFLGVRNALFAFVGIPITFLLTFIFMKVAGITINSISLFALIIVLGMIVDDAIIILENVYRYIEKGMPPKQAAVVGATEVALPVTAAVATTIAAFVPMMLVSSIIGDYMSVIPKTVIAALTASVFEAFFMLPCHIAEFGRMSRHEAALVARRRDRRSRLIGGVRRVYRRIVVVCLRRRYVTMAVSVVMLVGGALLLFTGLIKVELFGISDERERIEVKIWRPVGTRIEETEKTLARVEQAAGEVLRGEVVDALELAGYVQVDYQETVASHVGTIALHLTRRWRNLDETIARLRPRIEQMPEIDRFRLDTPIEGPPVGADVDIQIMGPEFAPLERIAGLVENELRAMPGVSEVRDNYQRGKNEIAVRVDEDKASFLGVNVDAVASTVYAAFEGAIAGQYQYRDKKIDIRLRADEQFRESLEDLRNLKVPGAGGRLVALEEIADFDVKPGLFQVHHYGKRRSINVTASVNKKVASPVAVVAKLQPDAERIVGSFPGYSIKFGGESQQTKKAMNDLYTAFGFGVVLIYIILATQFRSFVQPVMIMTIIPFAGFGVIFGLLVSLLVTGSAIFSIPVMVGIIALAGVVVNDSLVLVEFVNRSRRAGAGRWSSILQGCMVRVRPIILTSVTTIGGLLPMALGITGRSTVWGPLASAIAWGLAFSTVLTLVLIPCIYAMLDDVRRLFLGRVLSQAKRAGEPLPFDSRE